ncbi:claspin-like isoform X2 [Mya arenaria]|uniref:claspin-like isoform X2 n=1 Tax=Mya arenaria TaxID=6604 RepID=UPI0022E8D71B|nr:claspin-like isoform X2 [Mya arenaria]
MDIDEVDGELPVQTIGDRVILPKEIEKSQTDSGLDDGSNTNSSGNVDHSEDEEEDDVVLRKPKKSFHRILEEDSDESLDVPSHSQDVPSHSSDVSSHSQDVSSQFKNVRDIKKPEMTPEEVLEAVMNAPDSSDSEPDTPPVSARKKKLKRPVNDDSSDDENVTLMDTIKKTAKTGTEDLFDAEESDGETRSQKPIPTNLFDNDSDSSGCKSSGSELDKSDHEGGEDEGFNDSDIDPKLRAKLKKGAAKKERKKSARQAKREELTSIHSESQRMVRESRVNIPYHQPAPKSINDFLARANRKQQEYKRLGNVRDSRKVKIVQEVLKKTRLEARAKTQKEQDKYSDSDDDWNPDDDNEKSLKDRIDEKMKTNDAETEQVGNGDEGAEKNKTEEGSDLKGDTTKEENAQDGGNVNDNVEKDKLESEEIGELNKGENIVSNLDDSDKESLPEISEFQNEHLKDVEIKAGKDIVNVLTEEVETGSKVNKMKLDLKLEDDMEIGENVDEFEKTEKDNEIDNIDETSKQSDENKENIDPNAGKLSEDDEEKSSTSQMDKSSPQSSGKKTSPKNSASKRRKRIAALAGIDLDNVQPSLGGEVENFITLEDEDEAPRHPGVQNLMDRLSKHAQKKEKKKLHDTDISIISKDAVGHDREELKLNTFTYHVEEEDSNPLRVHEAPGAKLIALKEQLQEKMKAKREQARQKRQELYALDNEEGGFEEEAELSDKSDTDAEDGEEGDYDGEEDFEDMYGDDEEEIEKETKKKKNPYADEEADEDGDDNEEDDEEEIDEDIGEPEFADDDEYNLKLDDSDEEEDGTEEKDDESNDRDDVTISKPAKKESSTLFKEPEPVIPEKPFSMFGSKGRSTSIEGSQIQSGQRTCSSIPMPIEDSQDLCGSLLPELSSTQTQKHTEHSQDFNFLLEDSQSNMLDADGYLKTKSTGKKKPPATSFSGLGGLAGTQGNMDDLVGMCSGRFMDSQAGGVEKSSRKSLFDEGSQSNSTQEHMGELMGLCSGVFNDKKGVSETQKCSGKKRKASVSESDEDSVGMYSDNEEKRGGKENSDEEEAGSDKEEEGDTDAVDSDEDEERPPQKFSGFTDRNKHGKIRHEFVDQEAELSGSEYDSDENLDLAEDEDIMEVEEGDKDMEGVDREKIRDEVGRIALKQMIDEDKRELLRYQEMYLPDGDLFSEGGGRQRKFKWSNIDDVSQQDMFNDGSDNEPEHEETDDFVWRKERFEREKFLKEQKQQEGQDRQDDDNSQFMKLGKVFLNKQVSVESNSGKSSDKVNSSGAETPGFPGSFMKLSQKRGSFLARSKQALAKIAEMTKPVVNPSAGAKSSGKFTFSVISPDKEREAEAPKGKQRKANVPSQKSLQAQINKQPAKRPKLDSKGSTGASIFQHL